MKHLRFCLMTAVMECNERRHAQVVMEELGITYQKALSQSMGDQWTFFCCENLPEELPEYLDAIDANPISYIGYGLNKEEAERLSIYIKSKKL